MPTRNLTLTTHLWLTALPQVVSRRGSPTLLLGTMWGGRPRHPEMRSTGLEVPDTTQEAIPRGFPRVPCGPTGPHPTTRHPWVEQQRPCQTGYEKRSPPSQPAEVERPPARWLSSAHGLFQESPRGRAERCSRQAQGPGLQLGSCLLSWASGHLISDAGSESYATCKGRGRAGPGPQNCLASKPPRSPTQLLWQPGQPGQPGLTGTHCSSGPAGHGQPLSTSSRTWISRSHKKL